MPNKLDYRSPWWLVGVFVVFIAYCQSYPFEEVPSSSFSEKRWTKTVTISSAVDILLVVDNSYSMAGEQRQLAESFQAFASSLEESFGQNYHIAIITTGMTSLKCGPCPNPNYISCINDTGETGKFQDRVGKNVGTDENPEYEFESDPTCRVVTYENKSCFYDDSEDKGTVLVGITGCGYERGLAPLRPALDTLINDYNDGFLRDSATLAVVIISDEEDCGEVGDISEGTGYSADICYYASKGIDPYGQTEDPDQKPYHLTPVEDYYNFLLSLKGNQKNMVKFAAIVGVTDVNDPTSTVIEYVDEGGGDYGIRSACVTPGCSGNYCEASPGTRYIELADMFGLEEGGNGFIDTICQNDFSATMTDLVEFIECPRIFSLSEPILDPALANILINDKAVPRYSCEIQGQAQECNGPEDTSCPNDNSCVETWTYTPPSDPPDQDALGGTINFADHYDPCELFEPGDEVRIELIYVVE